MSEEGEPKPEGAEPITIRVRDQVSTCSCTSIDTSAKSVSVQFSSVQFSSVQFSSV